MSGAMIGTRLGPYEITAKLGAGGMGEVWRAHDAKLKRDVAIKVLPAEFVQDRERLARFQREAHPLVRLAGTVLGAELDPAIGRGRGQRRRFSLAAPAAQLSGKTWTD